MIKFLGIGCLAFLFQLTEIRAQDFLNFNSGLLNSKLNHPWQSSFKANDSTKRVNFQLFHTQADLVLYGRMGKIGAGSLYGNTIDYNFKNSRGVNTFLTNVEILPPINFSWRSRKHINREYYIGVSTVSNQRVLVHNSVPAFFINGNTAYAGETYNGFLDFSVTSQSFVKTSLGFRNKINKLSYGVMGNIYLGGLYVSGESTESSFFTQERGEYITAKANGSLKSSVFVDKDFDLTNSIPQNTKDVWKNEGFGISFGAAYNIRKKWELAFSVTDLGFISWRADPYKINFNADVTYRGVDVRDDRFFEGSLDTILNKLGTYGSDTSFSKFSTLTPVQLELANSFYYNRFVSQSLLLNFQPSNRLFRAMVLTRLRLGIPLYLNLLTGVDLNRQLILGTGFGWNSRGFNFNIGSQYLGILATSKAVPGVGLMAGMSFRF